jgi:chromosome segregation ATPase
MSREVASKEAVRAAREQLLNKGISPTQQSVQAITGGSMPRVNQFLKELDEERHGHGVSPLERLAKLVMALHAELQQQANDTVAKGAADSQKVVVAAKENLKVVQQNFAILQQELASAHKKFRAQSAEYAKTVGLLNRANEELAAQAVRLRSTEQARSLLQSRATTLEESLAKNQVALMAYQQHVADDREKRTNAFESALEVLKTEIREAYNQVSISKLSLQEATTQNLALSRDVERFTGEVCGLGNRIQELEDEIKTERAKSDSLRESETSLKMATASAEGQIHLLTQQLEDCSAVHNSSLNQKSQR